MKIEKVNLLSTECRPRKIAFIKYSNKSYTSNQAAKSDDCFTKALERENSLMSLNFLA